MRKFVSHLFKSVFMVACCTLLAPVSPALERDFKELGSWIEAEADNKNLPMLSIVLVDRDGIVWSHGVGRDAHNMQLIADGDTTYRIGSVSKLFTDIVVMQMVENGTLDLDEPVSSYLPDFRPQNDFGSAITLRLLMSHASGLVREPPVGNYFDATAPSLAETVTSLNDTTLVYAPGSKVQYSNAGIAVVGRVLEVVTGKPFATVLDDKVLRPLGMDNSAFTPDAEVIRSLPEAYMWTYQGDRTVAPVFELGMQPAGSMYSSMNELALFIDALIRRGEGKNDRVLKEETLNLMWTPQSDIRSGRGRSFGIGFNLGEFEGEPSVSHGGAIYGFATQLKVLPESKVGVAISTNLDMANGAVNRIADQALRVLLAAMSDQEAPEFHTSAPLPENRLENLIGNYAGADGPARISTRFGDAYVERINGLSLRLRELDGRVVIDDIMSFSDDFSYSAGAFEIFGNKYVATEDIMPVPPESGFTELIGEYGFDHNILYISEKFGQLHALIEWGMEYPLIDKGNGRFQFPQYGLYPNEQLVFERDRRGKINSVSLNSIAFARRPVGDIEGGVFQITPQEPVEVLEKAALQARPPAEAGEFRDADLVDITRFVDNVRLDIRYASNDNFLGVPVYSSARAFLQRPAAEALSRISENLAAKGYGLLVHDAYRPWYVTKIFWDATPEESKHFVADPSQGSRHNRGSAIDLTLFDLETGNPVDMVGLYDEMTPRSYPHYPGGTSLQRWHRELLRDAMESEGFSVYEFEWWHFDFDGWENYRILTETFEMLD